MLVINVKQRYLDIKSIYFNWKFFFQNLFFLNINNTPYYSFKMSLIGSNSPTIIFHSQPVLTLEDVGNIMLSIQ